MRGDVILPAYRWSLVCKEKQERTRKIAGYIFYKINERPKNQELKKNVETRKKE